VQQKMLTASTDDLIRWAAIPPAVLTRLGVKLPLPAAAQQPTSGRKRFWAASPQVAESPTGSPYGREGIRNVALLPLGDGIVVQLEGFDPDRITPDAASQLRRAAAPLIRLLGHLASGDASSQGSE
jgi:hypothetical protein